MTSVVGAVLDFSGSMDVALEDGYCGAYVNLELLSSLCDIAHAESSRQRRNMAVFASGVGTRNCDSDTCDFFALVDHLEALSLRHVATREVTQGELVEFAQDLSKTREHALDVEYWIRQKVSDHELRPLLLQACADKRQAQELLSLIQVGSSAKVEGAPLAGAVSVGLLAMVMSAAVAGPLGAVGMLGAALGALGTKVAADQCVDSCPAIRLKDEMVRLGIETEALVAAQPLPTIADAPTPQLVTSELVQRSRAQLEKASDLMWRLKPHVFGWTPLAKALGHSRTIFSGNSGEQILFIISDGEASDGISDAADACREMKRAGVIIIGCFLTRGKITAPKTLFCKKEDGWSKGAKAIFDFSSTGFRSTEPPVSLLVQQGWQVPDEGVSSLFAQANTLQDVIQFQARIQTALTRDQAISRGHLTHAVTYPKAV